jgi:hypothetical protein
VSSVFSDLPCLETVWLRVLRQSEVKHFHFIPLIECDIRRLDVAMDNPLQMSFIRRATVLCSKDR